MIGRIAIGLFLCMALSFAGRAAAAPGYCEFEVLNDRHEKAAVQVQFNDGSSAHFTVYPYEPAHFVSLYYHGHCHERAHVRVHLMPGNKLVYDGWVHAGMTLRMVPY